MIELKEVTYVRLGTPDLDMAEAFATRCLGLEVGDRSKKGLYLRSDDRAHTLYYSEGSPEDQTVGFEVEGSQLETAAATSSPWDIQSMPARRKSVRREWSKRS